MPTINRVLYTMETLPITTTLMMLSQVHRRRRRSTMMIVCFRPFKNRLRGIVRVKDTLRSHSGLGLTMVKVIRLNLSSKKGKGMSLHHLRREDRPINSIGANSMHRLMTECSNPSIHNLLLPNSPLWPIPLVISSLFHKGRKSLNLSTKVHKKVATIKTTLSNLIFIDPSWSR